MRVMAIDYGDARIGLAVSDLLGTITGEAGTRNEGNMERAARTIAEECKNRDVTELVLGLPKNMDGTEGPRAEKSRQFAALLEAAGRRSTPWPHPSSWRDIWEPNKQTMRMRQGASSF